MNKVFDNFVWEDFPSTNTAVDQKNLNKMNRGINEVDNRVIVLEETKATKIEVSALFKEVEFDGQTGIITFTRKNGATVTIDTPMEKIQTGIYYNPDTEKLVLPLVDGTSMEVDLSRLMQFDEFIDSDTIAFSVKPNGTVTAIVKDGSIEEKHLRPNYLAEIKVEAAKAQTSATNAAKSETNAKASENAAKASQTAAKTSEDNAATSATNAAGSASTASTKATAAANSASAAKTSETNAKTSETNAASSKSAAATSATNAANSASTAGTKSTEASNYATKAQSYAEGGTGTRPGENTDNAEYYYNQAKYIVESLSGALRPMGTVTFANLPALSNASEGDMYNVSDQFTTNANFKEGANLTIPAGSNVYKTADGKWDVLAGSPVTGVKGNKETSYRAGNVNLTPANVGAAPISHASTETTYGVSTATNYGHAMASSTTPKANGTAAVGAETAKFARGDHVHPLQTTVSGSSGSCTGNAATATNADKVDGYHVSVVTALPSDAASHPDTLYIVTG